MSKLQNTQIIKKKKSKGVFCIEGFWDKNLKKDVTLSYMFPLLYNADDINYLHYKCATLEEFKFYVTRWKKPSYQSQYPILYIGSHGWNNNIVLNKNNTISINELSLLLKNKCQNSIIFLACCHLLKYEQECQNLLSESKALAILGYEKSVFWTDSTWFELYVLYRLNKIKFQKKNFYAFRKQLFKEQSFLFEKLHFKFLLNSKN